MSQNTTREVILKMGERYGRRGREGRSRLLDELCGYGRKHATEAAGREAAHRPARFTPDDTDAPREWCRRGRAAPA